MSGGALPSPASRPRFSAWFTRGYRPSTGKVASPFAVCFAELGSPGVGSQRTMNRSELHRVHLLACSLGPSALLRDNFALTHQHFILLQRVSSFRYETPRHAHAHAAGCGGRAGGRRNGGARASSTPACWLLCSFSCSSSPQLHALIGAMHTPVGRATA